MIINQYTVVSDQTTMPTNNQCRDVERLQIQLITTILKLVKHDIHAVCALWYTENEVKTYGTKHVKELIVNIDKISLDTALKKYVFNLTSPEPEEPSLTDDGNVPEKVRAQHFPPQYFITNNAL